MKKALLVSTRIGKTKQRIIINSGAKDPIVQDSIAKCSKTESEYWTYIHRTSGQKYHWIANVVSYSEWGKHTVVKRCAHITYKIFVNLFWIIVRYESSLFRGYAVMCTNDIILINFVCNFMIVNASWRSIGSTVMTDNDLHSIQEKKTWNKLMASDN